MDTSRLLLAKPEPRKRIKGREKRHERSVIDDVWQAVQDRDGGFCRLHWFDATVRAAVAEIFGACSGRAEMAHVGEKRRSKTVGQDAEARHATTHAVLLCHRHHQGDNRYSYDRHAFEIEALTEKGCDGRVRFVARDGQTFEEPA